jgi:hypothetical protein
VPWCDACAKFWNRPSLQDGTCPTCGAPLEAPPERTATTEATDRPTAPWHFKLLLVALVLYLGYRAYQGVFWLAHHV